ncbi:MAG: hypothetical protein AAB074_17505 [Planctomycetota bacterium]
MLRRQNTLVSGLLDAMTSTNDYVQADRIRNLTAILTSQSARIADHGSKAKQDAARVDAELGFLSLIVAATIRTLADKGLVTMAEVLAKIDAVDAADGVKDGKITVDILRAILGVPRPVPQAESVPKPVLRRNR